MQVRELKGTTRLAQEMSYDCLVPACLEPELDAGVVFVCRTVGDTFLGWAASRGEDVLAGVWCPHDVC
jgi:hypothetical protein